MFARRNRHNRSGALTVEFALTLSLVVLFFWGAFECARANILLNSVSSASYEAARAAIVPGATADRAREVAQSILNAVGAREFTIDVTPDPLPLTADEVTVRIAVPLDTNSYLPPVFFRGKTIDRVTTLQREQWD